MSKIRILLVDDNLALRQTLTKLLETDGYEIVAAGSAADARKVLERVAVDIAVLDLRLSDPDAVDHGGLDLAQEIDSAIPKIIFTAYATVDVVRAALMRREDGSSLAAAVVQKEEGFEILQATIRESLAFNKELLGYYEEARHQARWTHRFRLGLIVAGGIVILGGGVALLAGLITAGILSIVVGALAEGMAVLFSKLSEDAGQRMDRYHKELAKSRRSS